MQLHQYNAANCQGSQRDQNKRKEMLAAKGEECVTEEEGEEGRKAKPGIISDIKHKIIHVF